MKRKVLLLILILFLILAIFLSGCCLFENWVNQIKKYLVALSKGIKRIFLVSCGNELTNPQVFERIGRNFSGNQYLKLDH